MMMLRNFVVKSVKTLSQSTDFLITPAPFHMGVGLSL